MNISGKALAVIASVLVLAAIIAAFITMGSPARQRQLKFDEQRVNDLANIQYNIVYQYWQPKGSLPAKLSDLNNPIIGFTVPKDPETSTDYEYYVKSDLSFQLCATFNLQSPVNSKNQVVPAPLGQDPYSQNWSHEAGRGCFDRTIDPELIRRQAVPAK